jgi:hypothetical protein
MRRTLLLGGLAALLAGCSVVIVGSPGPSVSNLSNDASYCSDAGSTTYVNYSFSSSDLGSYTADLTQQNQGGPGNGATIYGQTIVSNANPGGQQSGQIAVTVSSSGNLQAQWISPGFTPPLTLYVQGVSPGGRTTSWVRSATPVSPTGNVPPC